MAKKRVEVDPKAVEEYARRIQAGGEGNQDRALEQAVATAIQRKDVRGGKDA